MEPLSLKLKLVGLILVVVALKMLFAVESYLMTVECLIVTG